jgi:hypothetical protein
MNYIHLRHKQHLQNHHHCPPSPPIPAHFAANLPPTHRRSTSFQPNSRHPANRRPAASPKGAANQMIRVSWSQSKSWACGGARPSGNIASSLECALPFKCARILSITAGSSMQAMILTSSVHRSQDEKPTAPSTFIFRKSRTHCHSDNQNAATDT